MPYQNYNRNCFYLDGVDGDFTFYTYVNKPHNFSYVINEDYVAVYDGNSTTHQRLEHRHLNEFLDMCKINHLPVKLIKEDKTNKFTVEKLMTMMGIKRISIQYRCSKAIKEHREREIVAYSLGLFGGLIITKKFNEKEGFCAYKFVVMDEKYGRATFSNVEIPKALKYLETAKEMGFHVKINKGMENKLNSYSFMKGL